MRTSALPEDYGISGGSHACHGISCLIRQDLHGSDLNAGYRCGIEPCLNILAGSQGMHLQIHIFSVTGQSHAQRCCEGHDLMGAEASGIGYVQFCSAVGFLEKTHYIQMADKTYRSVFFEFNS